MKTLIPNKHEIDILEKLVSDDIFCFARLLKEQPPDGYDFEVIYGDEDIIFYSNKEKKALTITLQYPVGTRLGVRKTWGMAFSRISGDIEYCYKSSWEEMKEYFDINTFSGWRSPVTMPREAIRTWLVVEENEVRKVPELSYSDINKLGCEIILDDFGNPIDSTFRQYWNDNHTKPRKWEDGYVCYPYSMESYWHRYDNNYYRSCEAIKYKGLAWKGKPLTFYPNPYIEFPKARVE